MKNIDFSKNNCVFYRFITLYFQNIKNIAKMVEVSEEKEKSIF